MNNANSLSTDLEPLLIEHFRRASAICDFLDRHSAAMLGLAATQVEILHTHTEEPDGRATKPHLRLVRGGG